MQTNEERLGKDKHRLLTGRLHLKYRSLEKLGIKERNGWFATLSNHEHLRPTRRKVMTHGISDADTLVRSRILLSQLEDAGTTDAIHAGDHAKVVHLELKNVLNLASFNATTHIVVNLDERIVPASWVAMYGTSFIPVYCRLALHSS